MTYGEIVSQVKSYLNKGIWSDDDRMSSRHIIKIALRKRARVLKQEQEKKTLKDRFSRQRIPCMETIEVSKHECDCLPIKMNCKKLRRTKDQVPTPIKDYLYSVTTIDGNFVYSPTEFIDYKRHSRLQPLVDKPRYYVSNRYIYITDDKQLLSIEGVFEDPLAVSKVGCNVDDATAACINAEEQDFSLLPDLEDSVMLMTIEEIVKLSQYGKEDNLNNSKSNEVSNEQEDIQLRNA